MIEIWRNHELIILIRITEVAAYPPPLPRTRHFHNADGQGGGHFCNSLSLPPCFVKLSVVELSKKKTDCSRLIWPDRVNAGIAERRLLAIGMVFFFHNRFKSVSQNLFTKATQSFHQCVASSNFNKMTCCYFVSIEHLFRISSRRE